MFRFSLVLYSCTNGSGVVTLGREDVPTGTCISVSLTMHACGLSAWGIDVNVFPRSKTLLIVKLRWTALFPMNRYHRLPLLFDIFRCYCECWLFFLQPVFVRDNKAHAYVPAEWSAETPDHRLVSRTPSHMLWASLVHGMFLGIQVSMMQRVVWKLSSLV